MDRKEQGEGKVLLSKKHQQEVYNGPSDHRGPRAFKGPHNREATGAAKAAEGTGPRPRARTRRTWRKKGGVINDRCKEGSK